MTDADLRALERDADRGDPQAAAKLLVARRRTGEVGEQSLELAAYLGHTPAQLALGWESTGDPLAFLRPGQDEPYRLPSGLEGWGNGFVRWGRRVSARACLAAVRFKLPRWEQDARQLRDAPIPLDDLKKFVDDVEATVLEAERADSLPQPPPGFQVWGRTAASMNATVCAARAAQLEAVDRGWTDRGVEAPRFLWHLARSLAAADGAVGQWIGTTIVLCTDCGGAESVSAVRSAVRDELVDWCLMGTDRVALRAWQRSVILSDPHSYVICGPGLRPRKEQVYDNEPRQP